MFQTLFMLVVGLGVSAFAASMGSIIIATVSVLPGSIVINRGFKVPGAVLAFFLAAVAGTVWAVLALRFGDYVRAVHGAADWSVWIVGSFLALGPIQLALQSASKSEGLNETQGLLMVSLSLALLVTIACYIALIFSPDFRALWSWTGLAQR